MKKIKKIIFTLSSIQRMDHVRFDSLHCCCFVVAAVVVLLVDMV